MLRVLVFVMIFLKWRVVIISILWMFIALILKKIWNIVFLSPELEPKMPARMFRLHNLPDPRLHGHE